MSESFVKIIQNSYFYKHLPNSYKIPPLPNTSYNHLTFNIKSLSEYIDVINVYRSAVQKSKNNNGELIFRGMADHRWELLPSIARQTLITEETEYKMVKELMLLYPDEFSSISSNFDLLAKMQHYGLPTRLLDFTTNPLVALYFACQKTQKDSKARIISTNPSYPQYLDTIDVTDRYIEAVCSLCRIKSFASYYLEDLIENTMSFSQFIYSMQYPIFAKPQYSNDRIRNQSAVFMVFQNEIWDYGAMTAYEYFGLKKGDGDIAREYKNIYEQEDILSIYSKAGKNCIELEDWFITSKTLLTLLNFHKLEPDEPLTTQFINRFFKNKYIFNQRFAVVPQIKRIDDEIMRSSFCSILIEPKYKMKILEELDTININERFIFPELEYTVKYIKEKYWSPYKD